MEILDFDPNRESSYSSIRRRQEALVADLILRISFLAHVAKNGNFFLPHVLIFCPIFEKFLKSCGKNKIITKIDQKLS